MLLLLEWHFTGQNQADGEDEITAGDTTGDEPQTGGENKHADWLKEETNELFSHFNHRCLDSILRATRMSLDFIRKRVFVQKSHQHQYVTMIVEQIEV